MIIFYTILATTLFLIIMVGVVLQTHSCKIEKWGTNIVLWTMGVIEVELIAMEILIHLGRLK